MSDVGMKATSKPSASRPAAGRMALRAQSAAPRRREPTVLDEGEISRLDTLDWTDAFLFGYSNPPAASMMMNLCYRNAGEQLLRLSGIKAAKIPAPGCHSRGSVDPAVKNERENCVARGASLLSRM